MKLSTLIDQRTPKHLHGTKAPLPSGAWWFLSGWWWWIPGQMQSCTNYCSVYEHKRLTHLPVQCMNCNFKVPPPIKLNKETVELLGFFFRKWNSFTFWEVFLFHTISFNYPVRTGFWEKSSHRQHPQKSTFLLRSMKLLFQIYSSKVWTSEWTHEIWLKQVWRRDFKQRFSIYWHKQCFCRGIFGKTILTFP